jgi:hypothetical protein
MDSKIRKIKLLMERMKISHTFNEINENIKNLITEGVGDDIIRYVRNLSSSTNFSSVGIRTLEDNASNMGRAIENYDEALRSIRSGGSFESLKNLLNAKSLRITMDNFAENLSTMFVKYLDELGKTTNRVELKNYIMGITNDMPTDLLRNLTPSQVDELTKLNYLMNQLIVTDFHLDKLNRINEMWNKLGNPEDFRNVILGFVNEDGVKSIKELEDTFNKLDELKNGSTPKEQELYDVWRRIKEQIGLSEWDGTDFKTLLKQNFSNDPKFKILEKSFLSKLKIWGSKNINIKLKGISEKNLDWENVIIYYNKTDNNVYILEFKDKSSFNNYKKYLQEKGIDFTTPSNKENGMAAVAELAKWDLRKRKFILYTKITLGSAALVAIALCLGSAAGLTPESLAFRKKGAEGGDVVGEKGFITKFIECGWGILKSVYNLFEDEIDIFKNDILGPMQEFNGYILTEIEKLCPPDTSGEKQCCMECNNDEKLKSIIGNPQFINIYEKAIKNLDPKFLKAKATELGIENSDTLVIEILEKSKKEKLVSEYITEDGKPMSFLEILRMKCNQKSLPCVEKRVKQIYNEILNIVESKDCESIKNEAETKISELKSYSDAGYLTVNVSDKNKKIPKVYIDIMKKSSIFGKVTTMDEFFIVLRNWIDMVIIDAKCNSGSEDVEEADISINNDFENWCSENGKDSSRPKILMEFLWSQDISKLECGIDITEEWFSPNPRNKSNRSLQVFSIFDENFKKVFPSITQFDSEWDDAFNYWYDKQKSYCGY